MYHRGCRISAPQISMYLKVPIANRDLVGPITSLLSTLRLVTQQLIMFSLLEERIGNVTPLRVITIGFIMFTPMV